MISLQEFGEFAQRLILGQANEMMEALKRGDKPSDMGGSVLGTLWSICQPGVECQNIDVTERIKALGYDEVVLASVFVAHTVEGMTPEVIYVDGVGDSGPNEASFITSLNSLLATMLIDEMGMDPERTREMLNDPEQGVVDRTFREVTEESLSEAERAKIDAEVAAWRGEIDATIDSLFKGGGES